MYPEKSLCPDAGCRRIQRSADGRSGPFWDADSVHRRGILPLFEPLPSRSALMPRKGQHRRSAHAMPFGEPSETRSRRAGKITRGHRTAGREDRSVMSRLGLITRMTLAAGLALTGCGSPTPRPPAQTLPPEEPVATAVTAGPTDPPAASLARPAAPVPPALRPTAPEQLPSSPALAAEPPRPPPPQPVRPQRPKDTWVIFREAERDELDAICEARWTGGRRLEIKTENIKRITLDLTKLPPEAPQEGPWRVQIDGQGIEITGFTPKPGYTGKVRDLVRSSSGNWTVDKKRLYRGGL